ncbi:FAD-dependent oxidoreductase [Candidatus Saccharibacteria bacterium]|nr:FAD-dependent oxidoreductase [Candidatus Saccharibacteria bacterium]
MSESGYVDAIIIGAGMAGLTAAIYVARAGRSALVLESGVHGGQIIQTLDVANWPGEVSISGPDLMNKIYHQVNNLGVEVEYSEAIELRQSDEYLSVNAAEEDTRRLWVVKTDDGEYACGAVILAMGTEPRRLSAEQTKSAGKRPISYCATCDGAFYKGKPVVVVGSGNTAKYEMEYLSNICSKVYHIHHDEPIPEEAVAVFAAIGRIPNTKIVQDIVELDDNGYIVAGEDCKTTVPGVYVAGDVRTKEIRQLVTAAGDGAVAATNACRYLG